MLTVNELLVEGNEEAGQQSKQRRVEKKAKKLDQKARKSEYKVAKAERNATQRKFKQQRHAYKTGISSPGIQETQEITCALMEGIANNNILG